MAAPERNPLQRIETLSCLSSMLCEISILGINAQKLNRLDSFDVEDFTAKLEAVREVVDKASKACRTRKDWK